MNEQNFSATTPPTWEGVGFFVLLQLITEVNMALGLDDDGSVTIGRAMGIAGAFAAMAPLVQPTAAQVIEVLRGKLREIEPVMSRTVRPFGEPEPRIMPRRPSAAAAGSPRPRSQSQ